MSDEEAVKRYLAPLQEVAAAAKAALSEPAGQGQPEGGG
jgi:hypothetical protein